ncbi:hypothetical protein AVEN_50436-1 [Araneus ventricosus]|uniref:Uncharacterized protein n=1 Tax=Araneus ventricosus TaxID=182803 RepID=A0A4Y2RE85_ARAVE|nr:hypothetical protein AVEN_50436-1 [Araneus ventricosus]
MRNCGSHVDLMVECQFRDRRITSSGSIPTEDPPSVWRELMPELAMLKLHVGYFVADLVILNCTENIRSGTPSLHFRVSGWMFDQQQDSLTGEYRTRNLLKPRLHYQITEVLCRCTAKIVKPIY